MNPITDEEQAVLNTAHDNWDVIMDSLIQRALELTEDDEPIDDTVTVTTNTDSNDTDNDWDKDLEVHDYPGYKDKPEPREIKLVNSDEFDPATARLLRMTQVVGKFASTLALRPINVELSNQTDEWGRVIKTNTGAPAWSDSDNIWFDPNALGDITQPDNITSLKGLSLHEIAHILLTPRSGSNLAKDVQKAKMWRAFNALEDQRIEMMMTKRFGNVADWLTATVAKHILEQTNQHSVSLPLLWGRKYLPQELRDLVWTEYKQPHHRQELADLIDRYIVLNLADPKNYGTAFDIIKRYHELVDQLPPDPDDTSWEPADGWDIINDPNGHKHRKGGEWKPSGAKPMSKQQQDKLADKVAKDVAKQAPAPADGKQSGDTNDNNGGDGFSESGGGLSDVARKVLDDVLKRKAKEIATIAKQYNADTELESTSEKAPSTLNSRLEPVSPTALLNSKSFANELLRLKADYDPGWVRNVDQGRLSVERYSRGADIDECFDEWDIGREDAVDIEAVLLLDISPSMSDNIHSAYESMWAIKRALDKAGASTTVIAFSHLSNILYSSTERAGTQMKFGGMGGGTDPLASLRYAQNILAGSNRAIKLCIPITDGAWSHSSECDDVIRQLRRGGVLTALAFIENPGWNGATTTIDTHGCEVGVNITDSSHLLTLGREMVKVGIARNLGLA